MSLSVHDFGTFAHEAGHGHGGGDGYGDGHGDAAAAAATPADDAWRRMEWPGKAAPPLPPPPLSARVAVQLLSLSYHIMSCQRRGAAFVAASEKPDHLE